MYSHVILYTLRIQRLLNVSFVAQLLIFIAITVSINLIVWVVMQAMSCISEIILVWVKLLQDLQIFLILQFNVHPIAHSVLAQFQIAHYVPETILFTFIWEQVIVIPHVRTLQSASIITALLARIPVVHVHQQLQTALLALLVIYIPMVQIQFVLLYVQIQHSSITQLWFVKIVMLLVLAV